MQMQNIPAENASGVNVIFDALSPSAGDKSAAIWRPEAVGASPATRPRLELKAQSNGPRTARRIEMYLVVPYTRVGVDGAETVVANMPFRLEATIPGVVPSNQVADAVAYLQTIVASAVMAGTLKSGFAPS